MSLVIDQIGNSVDVNKAPLRIISLVPSITEYLYDLGLEDEVVGITKFCIHPKNWLKQKEIIGGTKQHHLQKIKDLNPNLIIASKEENVKSSVEYLSETCPVYVSDVSDFNSAIEMMTDIGTITSREKESQILVHNLSKKRELVSQPSHRPKVAYCIWKQPWMWAGSDTFISDMLTHAGFDNIISDDRYPELEMSEIIDFEPQYVFLSSEPFPFQEKHLNELEEQFPNTEFRIVDGEMFSWYGSRMSHAFDYFRLLHNDLKSK